MPKFMVSALPGLLIGLIVGFLAAQLGQGDEQEATPERDRKLAKLCMAEARKMLAGSDRATRQLGGPVRPERKPDATGKIDASERAESAIESALKRARSDKRWTVAHGKAAERNFPRVEPKAAHALAKKILAAVESGEISAEADAWLPEKE